MYKTFGLFKRTQQITVNTGKVDLKVNSNTKVSVKFPSNQKVPQSQRTLKEWRKTSRINFSGVKFIPFLFISWTIILVKISINFQDRIQLHKIDWTFKIACIISNDKIYRSHAKLAFYDEEGRRRIEKKSNTDFSKKALTNTFLNW